jgi:3-dehydroquinate synthase
VVIDPAVLATLPGSEFGNGMAEVIKYGVIRDRDFFVRLGRERDRLMALDPGVLAPVIRRCCEIKAEVVAADEREGGLRRILNFGHTIGHAVEAASDFAVSHGNAVAMGMVAAARLAVAGGHLSGAEAGEIRDLTAAFGLPVEIPADLDRDRIKRYLLTDKKTVAGRVFFVLPRAVGEVFITPEVPETDIAAVIGGRGHSPIARR